MLDSFPGTEKLDPDHYNGALAAALTQHPRAVAIACADVGRGVVQECLFRQALTAARIHDWCKRHSVEMQDWLARHDRRVDMANKCGPAEVDRSSHESVDELRARLGPTFGLKPVPKGGIGSHGDDELSEEEAKQRHREQTQRAVEASSRAILGEYASRGIEPIFTNGGLPVSPALVNSLVERGMITRDVLGARGPMAKARKQRKRAKA